MSPSHILATGALLFAVAASCGSADTGTSITLRNGSTVTLRVTEVGVNAGSDLISDVQPGAERKTLWHFDPGSKILVKAEDLNGELVFCHVYSHDDVSRSGGKLVITPGKRDCE